MKRAVTPEILDALDPRDPRAARSRRDLRLLNRVMGHRRAMARLLRESRRRGGPLHLVEIGAGDGSFIARVVEALPWAEGPRRLSLIDRAPCVAEATIARLRRRGWRVEVAARDVFEWASEGPGCDVCVANLFLHHFSDADLRRLLGLLARRAEAVAACEPRRDRFALAASRMVGLIGCNEVTRHDAAVSVRAGFIGAELSRLWPDGPWDVEEGRAGLFSHFFWAARSRRGPSE